MAPRALLAQRQPGARLALVLALLATSAAAAVAATVDHASLRGAGGRATQAGPGVQVGGSTTGQGRPPFPSNLTLPERGSRGQRAVDLLGDRLPEVAAWYGKDPTEFGDLLRKDGTLRLDAQARLYVVEEAAPAAAAPSASRVLDVVDGALVPDANTFTLHSRPGAPRTIYLDFDGAVLTGTAWSPSTTLTATPFDTDGVPGSFSSAELQRIQYIWQRVAEDYAPFDVDVTTQVPAPASLTWSDSTDTVYGTTAVITQFAGGLGDVTCGGGCGGIAYVGVFNYLDFYKPALVFYDMLGPGNEKYVAEAISHEVGHNGGLSHDGTASTGYYSGQGSGVTGWAPIMGVGYYQNLVQFSKGEYSGANNLEDDFVVMQGHGLPLRTDDYGNTIATATPLTGGTTSGGVTTFSARGVITAATDVDVVSFASSASSVTVTVAGASRSTNLDVVVKLLNAAGTVLATSNPVDALGATLTFTVPSSGTYYASIQGTGKGDPATTGYSSYGSVGNYALTVSATTAVLGLAPTAVASGSPTSGTAPLAVVFSSAGSSDPDGTIAAYSWAFGDGTTGTGPAPSHTYTTAGTFVATLTVTDNTGQTGTSSGVSIAVAPTYNHLSAFTMTTSTTGSKGNLKASASAVVKVVDASGAGVNGVTVAGTWSGLVSGTATATTNSNGVVSFTSASTKSHGTFTFTVTSVTKAGTSYDAAANTVPSSKSVSW